MNPRNEQPGDQEEEQKHNTFTSLKAERLTSIATNVTTDEIESDMLFLQERGKKLVCENISKWLFNKDVPFVTMYNTTVKTTQNEENVIKSA